MRPKTLKYIAGVFLALAVSWFLLSRIPSSHDVLPKFWPSAEFADKIIIRRPDSRIELRRAGGGWRLHAPFQTRADSRTVDNFLKDLARADISEPVSADPSRLTLFLLDESSGIHVTGFGPNSEVPDFDYLFGRKGSEHDSIFVRRPENADIREVRGLLRENIDKPVSQWADREVAAIERRSIVSLEYAGANQSVLLLQEDGAWSINGRPAEMEKLTPLLDLLTRLEADSILPSDQLHPLVRKGLNNPFRRIKIKYLSGRASKGSETETEIIVGFNKPGFNHPVIRSEEKSIAYEAARWRLKALDVLPEALIRR